MVGSILIYGVLIWNSGKSFMTCWNPLLFSCCNSLTFVDVFKFAELKRTNRRKRTSQKTSVNFGKRKGESVNQIVIHSFIRSFHLFVCSFVYFFCSFIQFFCTLSIHLFFQSVSVSVLLVGSSVSQSALTINLSLVWSVCHSAVW